MPKRPGIVALNPASEAFARYCELMPAVTDVRGEEVAFDLGGYAHFTRREGRERYVVWVRETLENPDEIRRDFDRRHPERELYVRRLRSDEAADEETFIVVVTRRVGLHFWTAFPAEAWYVSKVEQGKLLWSAEDS